MTQAITLSPDLANYFEDVVAEAMSSRDLEVSGAARTYLVGLLCDFTRPDGSTGAPLHRSVTLLLHDALEAPPAERFQRLRALGDGVLYVSGYFAPALERRTVDRGYVMKVGSTAYERAASLLRGDAFGPDVLRELAEKFETFVTLLGDVAESAMAKGASTQRDLLKVYERWLETGSPVLAEELGARGMTPTRGPGGLQ